MKKGCLDLRMIVKGEIDIGNSHVRRRWPGQRLASAFQDDGYPRPGPEAGKLRPEMS